jgi:hypothetical protein
LPYSRCGEPDKQSPGQLAISGARQSVIEFGWHSMETLVNPPDVGEEEGLLLAEMWGGNAVCSRQSLQWR